MANKVFGINDAGRMTLAGHDVLQLVETYGDPLVVLQEDLIRENCRSYLAGLAAYPRSRVHYAGKALLLTGLCRVIQQEGLGLDVVSCGELETAMAAGFPTEDILLHGNAKTRDVLRLALESGVGRIVIDNLAEIDRLKELAASMGKTDVKVMLRITPGIKPSTHAYVQTGQIDSKFGFNMADGAEAAVKRVMEVPALSLVGLHCHIGSQIFEASPFMAAAEEMIAFYARMKQTYGAPLDELNLGGGLGIVYDPGDTPPSIKEILEMESRALLEACRKHDVTPPLLYKEPGRSIIGEAGVTLYRVESIKQIEGVRNYVSVNGGMTDNPRFALYQARHEVLAASRMREPATTLWTVSGRNCESGDLLQKDVMLPALYPDDLLALLATGAYTYSMAGHYNRVVKPAVLLVAPGRVAPLAVRESLEDLRRLDRIPTWLQSA